MFSKIDIDEILINSLKELKKYDQDLLEQNTNERSITHHLAKYLEKYFFGWNVDCEYNRISNNPKKIKEIFNHLRNCDEGIQSDDIKAITVYPDIIVHKRGKEENLLVIEVKKSKNPDKNYKFDLEKLKSFKNELKYKYAVHIVLEDLEEYITNKEKLYFVLDESKDQNQC